MAIEIKLPELGENIKEGGIVEVLVKVGDTVAKNDSIVAVETDKATIEVPATAGGVVREVRVKAGDTVKVGHVLAVLEGEAADTKAKGSAKSKPAPAEPSAAPKPSAPAPSPAAAAPAAAAAAKPAPAPKGAPDAARKLVPASPAVRRLAYEVGVDIAEVAGSGPKGRLTLDDVKRHAKQRLLAAAAGGGGLAEKTLPDFSRWGGTEALPMSKIRKVTAENMAHNWAVIPHVTQFDKADITEVEAFRKERKKQVEAAGGNLTVTAILVRVVAAALKAFPQFNASVDMRNNAIVRKKFIHVGVAVDTEHGLLVPKIRDADRRNITEIATELAALSVKARDRKLGLDDMQGGTFTITNLGGIGGTAFTPIINWPEVAILGVSRGATEPVWRNGQWVPRLLLPLALSYDHRVIDGADGARFLRFICEALESPMRVLLEG